MAAILSLCFFSRFPLVAIVSPQPCSTSRSPPGGAPGPLFGSLARSPPTQDNSTGRPQRVWPPEVILRYFLSRSAGTAEPTGSCLMLLSPIHQLLQPATAELQTQAQPLCQAFKLGAICISLLHFEAAEVPSYSRPFQGGGSRFGQR